MKKIGRKSEMAASVGRRHVLVRAKDSTQGNASGRGLFDEIEHAIQTHVSTTPEATVAMTLWSGFTHIHPDARVSPMLGITSPTKRCGKTVTFEVISHLVPNPLAASNLTPATVFRTIEMNQPTLLIDEADTFLPGRHELRGILNSGHTKTTAFVLRLVKQIPTKFSTWCPKAIALIGSLPGTLEDRAIVIPLRRRGPTEEIEKFDTQSLARLDTLGKRLAEWASLRGTGLSAKMPEIPAGLQDRAADNWRPLFAIADAIGGDWPKRARAAAIKLSVQASDLGEMLLQDIKSVFNEIGKPIIESATMTDHLAEREDRPWPELMNGGAITKTRLAAMLRPFGIQPKLHRAGNRVFRGYERSSFQDAFFRYTA